VLFTEEDLIVSMASLNLSANGPSISKSYQSVVDYSITDSAKSSSTFAKWVLFSVSTPLVSAFQQDASNKESVLKVQDTGGMTSCAEPRLA
jgi:hypothetical protein